MAEVKLFGFWASPFAVRVLWALKLKQVAFDECVEEDLANYSSALLQYSRAQKGAPILFHHGRPIAESLVILEYIDETWKQKALLPQDTYERAKARFWAKFVDDKCVPTITSVITKNGEDRQRAAEEAQRNLKILEGGLERKPFFGGDAINIVDIAAGSMWCCVRAVEVHVGINLVDVEDMSLLNSWSLRFIDLPIIKEHAPLWDAILEHKEGLQKMLMGLST